jgi:hypothetical protein
MQKKVAGFIIAPLWNAFFNSASTTLLTERFREPEPTPKNLKPALRGVWYGGDVYHIDKISGKLATEFTPPDMVEDRVVPNPHEILYWVNKNDPLGPAPVNPYTDPQFLLWEVPAEKWITENGLPANALTTIPQVVDDIHRPELAPIVTITNPNATSTYPSDQKMIVSTEVRSTFTVTHVDLFFNDTFIGSTQSPPFEFSFIPSQTGVASDTNIIRVSVFDVVGNTVNTSIQVNFSENPITTQ